MAPPFEQTLLTHTLLYRSKRLTIILNNALFKIISIRFRNLLFGTLVVKSSHLNNYFPCISVCSLLSEKHTTMALIGGHNMQVISTIKSFTSTFQVPYITTGMAVNRTNQAGGYLFYASPYYARALADLVAQKEWDKVYYVYDTADGE